LLNSALILPGWRVLFQLSAKAGNEGRSVHHGLHGGTGPWMNMNGDKTMTARKQSLPALSPDGNLSRYLEQIRAFPMLEPKQEFMLAKSWKDRGDVDAAHQLVTSHLRLVAKIAMGYRGYGLPVADLISEGNLGMMHAVKKFEPDKGFRLATYAMWWIKAAIQEYILRSWSLVKIGTTAGQKKLFFNLRRVKGQIQAIDDGDLRPEQVTEIATQLDVSEAEVISMNQRMAGNDRSLNVPLSRDGEGSGEWQDWLEDDGEDQETTFAEHEEFSARKSLMMTAMKDLNEREQRILQARRLAEPPLTLEDLASEFGVSRERIRQIEVRAFEKLQKAVRDQAAAMNLLPQRDETAGLLPT
jgi:RNA polymerase sigma-32 factor